ncbi:MAG: radical SAM protein [Candidatus Pacearchaeota archaeon]
MQNLEEAFNNWSFKINELVRTHPLQIISWESTRRCNLHCKHCGSPSEEVQNSEELGKDEVVEAFRQIENDFDMSQFRHVNITGGEPFVREDILEILGVISQSPYFRNIDIQTNGIYIGRNPEVIDELKRKGVTGIGISIDGNKQTHDDFRGMQGSYDLAFRAAKTAVEKGLTVTVSMVANAKNTEQIQGLYEVVKKEIHPKYFRVMTIDPLGRADLNRDYLLSPDQTREAIQFLREEHRKNFQTYVDPKSIIVELGCGGWCGGELEGRVRPFIFHCVAGINNLGILYDGKLAACSNIPREFGFEGDLRKDKILDVWNKGYTKYRRFDWKKTGECNSCDEWDYCHGGPMHKMRHDGTRTDCLYQTIES